MTYANGKIENGYWHKNRFLGEGSSGKTKFNKAEKEANKPMSEAEWEARALQDRICP